MRTNGSFELSAPTLAVRGEFGDGLSDMVAEKVAGSPARARTGVGDPRVARPAGRAGVTRPVAARVTVELTARKVHSSAFVSTARDAMDLAIGRVLDRFGALRPARRA
jgi:hypothetical protein